MLPVFESTLPIFLLILAGVALRRLPITGDAGWSGVEQIAYWVLYPVLVFVTIVNADFSGLALDALLGSLVLGVLFMSGLTLALWPALRTTRTVAAGEFSSVFQTALRWNGFMALAIAQTLFPPAAAAVVALAMAAIILPINIICVIVITRFANREAGFRRLLFQIATNPLVIASAAALILRLGDGLYGPIGTALGLVGNAALGMGLIAIGAGLRVGDLASARLAIWLPVILKLAVFPVVVLAIAMILGVTGQELQYLALCAAVPTAMNGYLLARNLGGDAELYAVVTTMQTGLAFFTIPAVLALTAQLSG